MKRFSNQQNSNHYIRYTLLDSDLCYKGLQCEASCAARAEDSSSDVCGAELIVTESDCPCIRSESIAALPKPGERLLARLVERIPPRVLSCAHSVSLGFEGASDYITKPTKLDLATCGWKARSPRTL
eukprot:4786545-Amphidinium_carterae.1